MTDISCYIFLTIPVTKLIGVIEAFNSTLRYLDDVYMEMLPSNACTIGIVREQHLHVYTNYSINFSASMWYCVGAKSPCVHHLVN